MKNIFLYTIVAAFTLGGAAASAQTLPPGWPFPDRTERTTKKDKRDRDERVITDRDGRVINRDGKVYRNDGNLPPGQAKKKYGSENLQKFMHRGTRKSRRTALIEPYSYENYYSRSLCTEMTTDNINTIRMESMIGKQMIDITIRKKL